ncbi:hypothetical protein [Roseibium sp. M-1]
MSSGFNLCDKFLMLMFQFLKSCLHRRRIEPVFNCLDDRIDFGLGCSEVGFKSCQLCSAGGIQAIDLFGVLFDEHADEFGRHQIGLQALEDSCFQRLTLDGLSI